jgi:hypothetical protein
MRDEIMRREESHEKEFETKKNFHPKVNETRYGGFYVRNTGAACRPGTEDGFSDQPDLFGAGRAKSSGPRARPAC